MATPAIAMAVPIPVCVEILFPAKRVVRSQRADLGKTRGREPYQILQLKIQ